MRETITRYIEVLCAEEFYCEDDEEWQFRDGSACSICTSSALKVAQRFGGLVLGYHSIDNPIAGIGLPIFEGHDFALIRNRWLVDYWAWCVARLVSTPTFDLTKEVDQPTVARLYGPPSNWSVVELNCTKADGRRLDPAGEYAGAHDVPDHDAPGR